MVTRLVIVIALLPLVARADTGGALPDNAIAPPVVVRHVPPAGAQAASPLELIADAPSSVPTLAVHYRTQGQLPFQTTELVRQGDTRWIAVLPATAVAAPGLQYFLTAGTAPVFGTEAWPHTTPVTVSELADRKARDLARNVGRRYRVHSAGEWVDYGSRRVGGQQLADHYYRLDGDFTYRLLAYPLEEIRLGATQLIGDTPAQECPGTEPCTVETGYKAAGWFELGLGPVEGFRLDARMSVMATQEGFAVGGRGEGRLGVLDGSHVALGIEFMADVGLGGYFRLGWGTVPKFPMAATVEITNLPLRGSETGVRLYYDIAHVVGGGVRIGLRVGYAARTQLVAGFTGGTNLTVDF